MRLLHIWQVSDSPYFNAPILDAARFDQTAWRIAQGNWFGEEAFFQAPLYGYFLAFIYSIFGHIYLIPRLVQAILGALTAWMVFRLSCRYFDRKIALTAGLIVSFYGPLIHYCGQLLIPTLFVFFVTLFLLQFDSLRKRQTAREYIIGGVLLGLAAVTRPNILIFFPLAIIWIFFTLKDRGSGVLLFIAGTALVIFPVTVRNYIVSKDVVLISSQAGVNFYMGNNTQASGFTGWVPGTSRDWWDEGYPETIGIAERAIGHQLKPSQVSAYWWKRSFLEISEMPMRWFGLILKKTRYLFAGYEISDTEEIYYQRRFSGVLAILLWRYVLAFPFGLLLPLSILGLILSFRWREQSHWLLFQVSYALSVIIFLVTARYRLPLVPIFSIWAAAGMVLPFRRARGKKIKEWVIIGSVFGSLLVLLNLNPRLGRSTELFDGALAAGIKYLEGGQYEKAAGAFREAVSLDSTSSRAANGLGVALINLGRTAEAKSVFERVLYLDSTLIHARNNLARIQQQVGEYAAAKRNFLLVLTQDSTNVVALRGLADAAMKLEEYDLSESYYREAYSRGASDPQTLSRWAKVLFIQEKYAEALRVNAILIRLQPNHPGVRYNQALFYIKCDSLDQATSELEIVLRLDPGNTEAKQQLQAIRSMLP